MCFFLMPASVVAKTLFYLWNTAAFWFNNNLPWAKQQHAARVKKIQAVIREWNAAGCKTKLCSARPGTKHTIAAFRKVNC